MAIRKCEGSMNYPVDWTWSIGSEAAATES